MFQAAVPLITGAVNAVAPQLGQAGADIFNAFTGNAAGNAGTVGLNTDPVFDTLGKAGVKLDPAQETALANHLAKQAGQQEMDNMMKSGAYNAVMGNKAGNLSTQRQMALNAQSNAANNVANQLNSLNQARSTASNTIGQAMNAAMNAFSR